MVYPAGKSARTKAIAMLIVHLVIAVLMFGLIITMIAGGLIKHVAVRPPQKLLVVTILFQIAIIIAST